MNTTDFFNLFLIISSIIGFGFSGIIFSSKYRRDKSMLFLNLMILTISLNNLQSWVLAKKLFQYKFELDYLQIPWHFLTIPFFYTFLIHYLNIQKKTVNILSVIFTLFTIAIIAQVAFVIKYSGTAPTQQLDYIYERYTSIEEVLSFIISILIFAYSFFLFYKKEKWFIKILSYDDLKWIHTFFKLLIIAYILWVIALIIKIKLNYSGFLFSYYPLRVFSTVTLFWLGYQGIIQLRILKERKTIRKSIQENIKNNKPKEHKKLEDQFEQIDSFIRKKSKFLLPKYTLQNLSKDIKIGSSTLSAVINSNANKSFVDYINEMRVEQAKRLLIHPEYNNYTIISIGLESGFNSKSTFYTVFKKHTGYTPLNFKNYYKKTTF